MGEANGRNSTASTSATPADESAPSGTIPKKSESLIALEALEKETLNRLRDMEKRVASEEATYIDYATAMGQQSIGNLLSGWEALLEGKAMDRRKAAEKIFSESSESWIQYLNETESRSLGGLGHSALRGSQGIRALDRGPTQGRKKQFASLYSVDSLSGGTGRSTADPALASGGDSSSIISPRGASRDESGDVKFTLLASPLESQADSPYVEDEQSRKGSKKFKR